MKETTTQNANDILETDKETQNMIMKHSSNKTHYYIV